MSQATAPAPNEVLEKGFKPRTKGQADAYALIGRNTITFLIGPAGTGKTKMCVSQSEEYTKNNKKRRTVVARPAVLAGENIGFLTGNMLEKMEPYMMPLYDELGEIVGKKEVTSRLLEKLLEVVTFGFMRGRTLKNAFIIVDEAQNATYAQLKMILTRLGENSKMVINGDPSQCDLPEGPIDFLTVIEQLKAENIQGMGFGELTEEDAVRHPMTPKVLKALTGPKKRPAA